MADTNPRISVIIPVYQVEKYISNTIKSVIAQTYTDYEIILVNDGTTDNSIQIAEEILNNSCRPFRIINTINGGQGAARNAGLGAARGDWVYFLDSDDVIQPFTFSLLIAVALKENPELIFTDFQYVDDKTLFEPAEEKSDYVCLNRNRCLEGFLDRSIVPLVPGSLYRRAFLIDESILHREIRWSEDQFFMWSVLAKINKAVHIRAVTYNYYRHANTIMNSAPLNRIVDAYHVFMELPDSIDDKLVKKYLVPRWVLGCLHEIALRNNKTMWNEAIDKLEANKNLQVLSKFPNGKISVLAMVGCVSDNLLRLILRRA